MYLEINIFGAILFCGILRNVIFICLVWNNNVKNGIEVLCLKTKKTKQQ